MGVASRVSLSGVFLSVATWYDPSVPQFPHHFNENSVHLSYRVASDGKELIPWIHTELLLERRGYNRIRGNRKDSKSQARGPGSQRGNVTLC